jgi:guanidinopropionase
MSDETKTGMPMVPRFMGMPTFMRVPYTETFEGLDIAMVGVPYDGGVTNRPGARHGPREIRNQSSMLRGYHPRTRVNPFETARIADVGDVPLAHLYDIAGTYDDITGFFSKLNHAGCLTLAAGGDHSITHPIFRAIAAKRPVGMIHVDAHTDTWDSYQGSKFHHGSPFRFATEEGLLDPKRTVQIGIRGGQSTTEGWDYSRDKGMRVIFMEEFTEIGVAAVIAEARRVVGDGPTYVSFDVDGLDPVYAPGTGTPEVGGITTVEALTLLRGLYGLNLVGADVVEVSPPFDHTGNTALVGATIMYELLCLLADVVARR